MRFYRLLYDDANLALAVETPDGSLVDLTSIDPDLTEIEDLALASSLSGITIDEAARNLIDAGDGDSLDLEAIVDGLEGARLELGPVPGQAVRPARGVGGRRDLQDERDGAQAREQDTGHLLAGLRGGAAGDLHEGDAREVRRALRGHWGQGGLRVERAGA